MKRRSAAQPRNGAASPGEPKANQQEKISFRLDDLRKFFPKSYTPARIQERIMKLLEADCRKRQREQSR